MGWLCGLRRRWRSCHASQAHVGITGRLFGAFPVAALPRRTADGVPARPLGSVSAIRPRLPPQWALCALRRADEAAGACNCTDGHACSVVAPTASPLAMPLPLSSVAASSRGFGFGLLFFIVLSRYGSACYAQPVRGCEVSQGRHASCPSPAREPQIERWTGNVQLDA